jgi:hypothetical protein
LGDRLARDLEVLAYVLPQRPSLIRREPTQWVSRGIENGDLPMTHRKGLGLLGRSPSGLLRQPFVVRVPKRVALYPIDVLAACHGTHHASSK